MISCQAFQRLLSVALVLCSESFVVADEFQEIAIVRDDRINESSGMAASRTHPGMLWIHNDSGDDPRLFLIAADGETRAVVNLIGAKAHDWEDMCSFEVAGQSWLLIGDIGDNDEKRSRDKKPCALYLVKEPKIPQSNGQPSIRWPVDAAIPFVYDDGPHNCESLAVDVERREILLLTKKKPQDCGLYVLPLSLTEPSDVQTAKRIASPFLPFATAMDISPDGHWLVVASMLDGIAVERSNNSNVG